MLFYKRFIGDYRAKTARLTPLEHGVYGLFLDELYATEAPLPLDAGELANIVGARTDADEAAIQKVIGRYFKKTVAGWVNPRVDEEFDNTRKFSAAQKARAEKRWRAVRPSDAKTLPDGYRGNAETMPGAYPKHASHSHSQTPQPKPEKTDPSARLPTSQDEKFDFDSFKEVYPKRSGAQPWAKAVKAAKARIKEGASLDAMIYGALRYAEFCEATDKTGTEYVMQAVTFLGQEKHFMEPWTKPPKRTELEQRNYQNSLDVLARVAAKEIPAK